MKMNIKNVSALIISAIFLLVLVGTAILYTVSYNISSDIKGISLETISGDESIMENVNVTGTIGGWEYTDFNYVNSEQTNFTVDIKGNLESENVKSQMKWNDYNKPNSMIFDVNLNIEIPQNAELTFLESDKKDEEIGLYSTDKFNPIFAVALTNVWSDTFLVVKPDYYVECNEENKVSFVRYAPPYGGNNEEVNIVERPIPNKMDTENLTVKIGDDYYMVLPTFESAVGTNGIYKFNINEDYISFSISDYIEGASGNYHSDILQRTRDRYEKLIDIPVEVDGKIVQEIFEYNGDLILVSTKKNNVFLTIYDIENNIFTKEMDLGEFSNITDYHNNDEFFTIQYGLSFTTLELESFERVNESKNEKEVEYSNVFYNGENLFVYNVFTPEIQFNEANVDLENANEILVYKDDRQLFKGKLNTNVYQDYTNVSISGTARQVLGVNFENKVVS